MSFLARLLAVIFVATGVAVNVSWEMAQFVFECGVLLIKFGIGADEPVEDDDGER